MDTRHRKTHARIMRASAPILAAVLKHAGSSSQAVDIARDAAERIVAASDDPLHDAVIAASVAAMMPMSDDMLTLEIIRAASAVRLLDMDVQMISCRKVTA